MGWQWRLLRLASLDAVRASTSQRRFARRFALLRRLTFVNYDKSKQKRSHNHAGWSVYPAGAGGLTEYCTCPRQNSVEAHGNLVRDWA